MRHGPIESLDPDQTAIRCGTLVVGSRVISSFSSPFQSWTVNVFGADMHHPIWHITTTATFCKFMLGYATEEGEVWRRGGGNVFCSPLLYIYSFIYKRACFYTVV